MWGSMLTVFNWGTPWKNVADLGLTGADWGILALSVAVMCIVSALSAKKSVQERLYDRPVLSWVLCGALLLTVVLVGIYGVGYDATQFIYDQF